MYAILNKVISVEHSNALCDSLPYIDIDMKEICFANNALTDKQFAKLLTGIMEDKKLYMNLQKITYFNNEFGLQSIEVLTKLFLNKNARYPITQISLVDVKKCVTIEPLLKALISKDNYL